MSVLLSDLIVYFGFPSDLKSGNLNLKQKLKEIEESDDDDQDDNSVKPPPPPTTKEAVRFGFKKRSSILRRFCLGWSPSLWTSRDL